MRGRRKHIQTLSSELCRMYSLLDYKYNDALDIPLNIYVNTLLSF